VGSLISIPHPTSRIFIGKYPLIPAVEKLDGENEYYF
jgi:hypothetical protein